MEKTWKQFGIFILMFVMCIGLVSFFMGFGSFAVVDCKDLTGSEMDIYCDQDQPGTTLAMRFPEHNCKPQNIPQPISETLF